MHRNLNWIAAATLAGSACSPAAAAAAARRPTSPPPPAARSRPTTAARDAGGAARRSVARHDGAHRRGHADAPSDIGVLAGYSYAIEGDGGELGADAEFTLTLDAACRWPPAGNRRHALGAVAISPPHLAGLRPERHCPRVGDSNWLRIQCDPWPFEPASAVTSVSRRLTKLDHCHFLPAEPAAGLLDPQAAAEDCRAAARPRAALRSTVIATTVADDDRRRRDLRRHRHRQQGVYGVQFTARTVHRQRSWSTTRRRQSPAPPYQPPRSFGPAQTTARGTCEPSARDNNGNWPQCGPHVRRSTSPPGRRPRRHAADSRAGRQRDHGAGRRQRSR